MESILVVFTSDHGELLGESGHGGIFDHGHLLILEFIKVPLVFLEPDSRRAVEIDVLSSGTDIGSTVSGAMNLDPLRGCRRRGPLVGIGQERAKVWKRLGHEDYLSIKRHLSGRVRAT